MGCIYRSPGEKGLWRGNLTLFAVFNAYLVSFCIKSGKLKGILNSSSKAVKWGWNPHLVAVPWDINAKNFLRSETTLGHIEIGCFQWAEWGQLWITSQHGDIVMWTTARVALSMNSIVCEPLSVFSGKESVNINTEAMLFAVVKEFCLAVSPELNSQIPSYTNTFDRRKNCSKSKVLPSFW